MKRLRLALEESRNRLEIVTTRPKQCVSTLSEVPSHLVEVADVATRMERPKTLDPSKSEGPWYPQLDKSFLLRVPDGYIGDNVVFDQDRYYGFGKWWLGSHDDAWTHYRNTVEVRHIDKGISITSWGGEAFQLFILDTLPRLPVFFELLERPGYEDLQLVSHCAIAKTARWFWKKLGLTDRIVQKPMNAEEGMVIHADLALYPGWEPNLGHYGLHPRGCLLPVQQSLGVLDGTAPDLVLYLARPQWKIRSVANEDELLARLKQVLMGSGYELQIFQSSGNLQHDLDLFKRAKIILGPHGGALANMVFAQPGTQVIEFLPIYRLYREGENPRPAYWGLSQAAGHDYWTIEPASFDFITCGMSVDVEEVAAVVDYLVRNGASGSVTESSRK